MKHHIIVSGENIWVTFGHLLKDTKEYLPENGFFIKSFNQSLEQFVERIKSYHFEISIDDIKKEIIKEKLR